MEATLIIGLGNPGLDYEGTYHNVGALALEHLVRGAFRRHGDSFEYQRFGGKIFVRSLVFMNESGLAARDAAEAFDIAPENIAVLHDESDLPLGEYKIVRGGGSAGHKGVQSIIDHLHTEDFWRVRIGIRDPREHSRKKAGDFVLDAIRPDDREKLEQAFASIADALGDHLVS